MEKRTSEKSDQETRSTRATLWALVVLIPWSIAMWLAFHDWYNEFQLGKRAATTSGVITRIEHENHGQFDYEYSVVGTIHKGGEILPGVSLGVGQQVRVSYIPDAPDTSTLMHFGAVGTRPVPIVFCSFIALYCYFRLRKFLRGPDNPYDR